MTIRLRHKASGILATTGQDPRALGTAWEILGNKPAEAAVENTDKGNAIGTADEQPAEATAADAAAAAAEAQDASAADADNSQASDDAEGVAEDGDSAADGRGDEPTKGSQSTRKGARRGTTAKSGKSSTDKTA